MTAIAPLEYENNDDGFMPPSSGGVLAFKSVPFDYADTTATLYLPEGAVLIDTKANMSTVFDGEAPEVDIELDGTAIGSFDPGNAVATNASGKLPMRGSKVTLAIDADESAAGAGVFVVIYAVMG